MKEKRERLMKKANAGREIIDRIREAHEAAVARLNSKLEKRILPHQNRGIKLANTINEILPAAISLGRAAGISPAEVSLRFSGNFPTTTANEHTASN